MNKIKVETIVEANIKKVWKHWNNTESIKGWAFASDTWECLYAENDLLVGGRFLTRMSSKDGKYSFDFTGTYTEVSEHVSIKYLMDKSEGENRQRDCEIVFTDLGNNVTKIEEEFYPEEVNSAEKQREGWAAILENFKKFVSNI